VFNNLTREVREVTPRYGPTLGELQTGSRSARAGVSRHPADKALYLAIVEERDPHWAVGRSGSRT
jgi:hypothetical protein